jgi:hypothetical protein
MPSNFDWSFWLRPVSTRLQVWKQQSKCTFDNNDHLRAKNGAILEYAYKIVQLTIGVKTESSCVGNPIEQSACDARIVFAIDLKWWGYRYIISSNIFWPRLNICTSSTMFYLLLRFQSKSRLCSSFHYRPIRHTIIRLVQLFNRNSTEKDW